MVIILIAVTSGICAANVVSVDATVGRKACSTACSELLQSQMQFLGILSVVNSILVDILPCSLMVPVNIYTVYVLIKTNSKHTEDLNRSTSRSTELQASIMLLLTAFSFMLFTLPDGILRVLYVSQRLNNYHFSLTSDIYLVLTAFRSGSNFILYFISGSQFRRVLLKKISFLACMLKS